MCGKALERDRFAVACRLETDRVAEERRRGVDVVCTHTDVSDSPNPRAPPRLPACASCEPHLHARIPAVRECSEMLLEPRIDLSLGEVLRDRIKPGPEGAL